MCLLGSKMMVRACNTGTWKEMSGIVAVFLLLLMRKIPADGSRKE